MELVRVGRFGRTHGVRGDITLDSCALTPAELEAMKTFTWRGAGGVTRELVLESVRPLGHRIVARFHGAEDREAAQSLAGGELLADSARLPDPGPNHVYTFQLIGLDVRTEDGRELGKVESVLSTGAHAVYVVRGAREILIPAAPHVLKRVDLKSGTITVDLPAGLEDL